MFGVDLGVFDGDFFVGYGVFVVRGGGRGFLVGVFENVWMM